VTAVIESRHSQSEHGRDPMTMVQAGELITMTARFRQLS
jgi:hypothetical protein